ncbi:Uncharacterised protein [uncultured archaeon]|nr:Uncharacterised protein [uncultured archaeon]
MAKVIRGGNMFFEDDIKIIDAEIDSSLNIPEPPVFSRDCLQIIYNGHIFVASKNPVQDKRIKVYTRVFGLDEIESPKIQEDRYFSENLDKITKVKQDFIERVVNGITDLGSTGAKVRASNQLGQELIERINKVYEKMIKPNAQSIVGKGLVTKLDDGSIFNSEMQGSERILVLDKKVYDLLTIPEYISIFEGSFDPDFYKKIQKLSGNASPKDISDMITANKDKVHRKALPMVRNKIYHSERSAELFLDDLYWIPRYRETTNTLEKTYQKLIEKNIKVEAARSIKW